MPRKDRRIGFGDEGRCFERLQFAVDNTTSGERCEVARLFCMNVCAEFPEFEDREIVPISLILASLLEIEHPLIVSEARGMMYSLVGCEARILMAILLGTELAVPVGDVVHRIYVDNS